MSVTGIVIARGPKNMSNNSYHICEIEDNMKRLKSITQELDIWNILKSGDISHVVQDRIYMKSIDDLIKQTTTRLKTIEGRIYYFTNSLCISVPNHRDLMNYYSKKVE